MLSCYCAVVAFTQPCGGGGMPRSSSGVVCVAVASGGVLRDILAALWGVSGPGNTSNA